MKKLLGISLGFMSGFLIYMILAMVTQNPNSKGGPSSTFVAVTFLGGWAASTYFLLKNSSSVSKIVKQGALLGAAEWILFALAGLVLSGRSTANVISESGGTAAESAGAVVGGGIAAAIAGGVSIAMASVCLIVFAIAYFAGKEKQEN
jgi:hypothetical protein